MLVRRFTSSFTRFIGTRSLSSTIHGRGDWQPYAADVIPAEARHLDIETLVYGANAPLAGAFSRETLKKLVQENKISVSVAEKLEEEVDEREHAHKEAIQHNYAIAVGVAVVLWMVYHAYERETAHMKHLEEHPEPYVPYEHLHVIRRKFPFGNGKHTLFHNPARNYDPDTFQKGDVQGQFRSE